MSVTLLLMIVFCLAGLALIVTGVVSILRVENMSAGFVLAGMGMITICMVIAANNLYLYEANQLAALIRTEPGYSSLWQIGALDWVAGYFAKAGAVSMLIGVVIGIYRTVKYNDQRIPVGRN